MKNHTTQGRTSKFSVLLILIFLVSLFLLTFSACDNQVDVASISVIEESIPQNVRVSEFDITKVQLRIVDSQGNESSIYATPVMLTTDSRNKLTQDGDHSITLRYQGKLASFTVRLFNDEAELVTITFKDHNGNVIQTVVEEKGGSVTPPPHPVREGYIADGWIDASNQNVSFGSIEQSIEVRAKYKEDVMPCTVTFKDYKGIKLGTVQVPKGNKIPETVSYDQPPEVASYEWYYGNNKLNIETFTVTQDITIEMRVEFVHHTITYQFIDRNNRVQILGEESVRYGYSPNGANDAINKLLGLGYEFKGWDRLPDVVRSNVTVTAQAEMYKYRLEFRSYNQVTYKEVFHGENVTPESAQTKPGYNFVGWDKSLENITQDMVINAIYAPKEFTITVHDGDIFENKTMPYDYVITAENLNDLKNKGEDYILLGIYQDPELEKAIELPYRITGTAAFYTKWINKNDGNDELEFISGPDDSYKILNGYSGNDTIIYIPSTKEGKPVQKIANGVFENKNIAMVYFGGSNLESIGDNAFANTKLNGRIELPEGLKEIGERAFSGCEDITEIVLPQTLNTILEGAFENCSSLISVVFDEESALTEIENSVFKGCSGLKNIILPASVQKIGQSAFEASGIESISLLGIEEIGEKAFIDSSLALVSDTDDLTKIGRRAFENTSLVEISLLSVTQMGEYAFANNKNLQSVIIGAALSELKSYTFMNCGSLTQIDFETEIVEEELKGIQTIESFAFLNCNNLSTISLPSTLSLITPLAFEGAYKLEEIIVDDENETFETLDGVLFLKGEGASLFFYPSGKVLDTYEIPEETVAISSNAFNDANIANIIVPESLTILENYAFNSRAISTIRFLGDVPQEIGGILFHESLLKIYVDSEYLDNYIAAGFEKAEAYSDTSEFGVYDEQSGLIYTIVGDSVRIISANRSFTSITVPATIEQKTVTHINDFAFENCDSLESIQINAVLVELGEYAFKGCVSLTTINFAAIQRDGETTQATIINLNAFEDTPWYQLSELVVIADTAFEYKLLLDDEGNPIEKTSLVVPNGVQVLKNNLFEDSALEEIILPQSLEVIGDYAFKNTAISQITIPSSVYSLGEGTFENCVNLDTVNILTNSLRNLNAKTFKGCESLKQISIPDSIRVIGEEAFMDCYSLAKVNISNSAFLTKIGARAFMNCVSLPVMTIPVNVGTGLATGEEAIEDEAFKGCDSLVYIRIWNKKPFALGLDVFEPISILYVDDSEGQSIYWDYYNAWTDYQSQIEEQSDTPEITFETNKDAEGNVVAALDHIIIEKQRTAALYTAPILPYVEGYQFVCWTAQEGTEWVPIEFPFYTRTNATLRARWLRTDQGSLSRDDLVEVEDGYKLIGYNGWQTIVVIPAYYGNLPIMEIGEGAFAGRDDITEIRIAQNSQIALIGRYAFEDMISLISINIPSSVKEIEEGAFAGCVSLEQITIPNSVERIGENTFDNCTNLDITFQAQSTLKYASINSFEDTKWYQTQKDSDSDFVIAGNLLIEYLSKDQYLVTLPAEVTAIREEVFMNDSDIVTVEIHSNIKFIGDRAFYNCSSLINIDFEDAEFSDIEYVGEDAFALTPWMEFREKYVIAGTVLIKYVGVETQIDDIPNYITIIDEGAFAYNSMEEITLPNSLKKINAGAFAYCNNLQRIVIPNNGTYIGEDAFRNCTSLKSVVFQGNALNEIGPRAFMGCSALGTDVQNLTLVLPSSLRELGEQAFEGCGSLTKADLSNTKLTKLNTRTFYGLSSLNEIILPTSLVEIDEEAFGNCITLGRIQLDLNSALTYIAEDALTDTLWYNRELLEDEDDIIIYLGNVLLKYRHKADSDFRPDVVIPLNIKYIAKQAFMGSLIASVAFPSGLLTIGESAFEGCTFLNNVIIPDSVESIGTRAFRNCVALDNIELGRGLLRIEEKAFENSINLSKIILKRISYGELTVEQESQIENAIRNETLKAWLEANPAVFQGTEIANTNAFNNTSDFLRIYVLTDSRNINIEIYKVKWEGKKDNLYNYGELPTVEFITIGNATRINPISVEWLLEEHTRTEYKDHTLLGWEIVGEEGELITFPFRVLRDIELNPIWISNNRPINDPDLGLNYDTVNSSYVIYAFNPATMLVSDTLVIASMVSNLPLTGINEGVFTQSNTQGITKVLFTKKDNLTVMQSNMFKNFVDLEQFVIEGDRSNYTVIDGVLYTADLKTLVAYPRARKVDGEIAKTFTIPNSVTTILAYAFAGCALEELNIPSSVKFIGEGAFDNTAYLEDINFAEDSEFEEVAYGAFDGSKWYQDISDAFRIAGSYLLSYFGSQSTVTVPQEVKVIGERAFENNGLNNIEELIIPASVVRINQDAFINCSEIESIIFQGDSQLMYVANEVFNATSWIDKIDPEMNTFIIAGNILIKYNGKNTHLTLPAGIKVIGYEAFSNATFSTITLQDGLQRIDESAFFGANNLTSITIPSSVTVIGDDAFYNNVGLKTVTFAENSQLRYIGNSAFANSYSLESITIPNSVKTIGNSAFEYCRELKTVQISQNSELEVIGEKAFKDSKIIEIYIPNGLREIKTSTFENCSSLLRVSFSENNKRLAKIGQNAFRNCISLGSDLEGREDLLTVELPDNVTIIDNGAFYGCSSMYGIRLEEVITYIGEEAFRNCSALANITIRTAQPPTTESSSFTNVHPNVRIYVNSSKEQSVLRDYMAQWGNEIVAKSNFIQERGETNYPLVEIYDIVGGEETLIDSFRAEFLTQQRLPQLSDPIKGMSTGYRKDTPNGVEICTPSAPYEIIRAESIKLFVIWGI